MNSLRVEQHDMVVGRLHSVHPLVVAHFKMLANLLTRETHHVDVVLVAIELEHVVHVDVALVDDGIEGERGIEGDVGTGD